MKGKKLAKRVKEIQSIETAEALWYLAKTNNYQADLLMQNPPYNVFTVPKKDGTKRFIEDPYSELKKIQDILNDYLQPLYYFNKTTAAYGYIIKPDDDKDETRNIISAAKKHSNNSYLLNIDIEDFFHYVSFEKIQ